jgi:hypothetical protein
MPLVLPASFKTEIERPQGRDPIVVFAEIQLVRPDDGVPPLLLRVCAWHQSFVWRDPTNPAGTGSDTWYPLGFTHTEIGQEQEGRIQQVDVTVDNTTRLLMRYLHSGEGVEGNYLWLYRAPASALTIAYPNEEFEKFQFRIASVSATDVGVTFHCEQRNFLDWRAPADVFVGSGCRWAKEFGGTNCGYVINSVAAFTTCPGTIAACIARGEDHRVRGLPVIHPARFGAFPGIASNQ